MIEPNPMDGRGRDGEILTVTAVLVLIQATLTLVTSVGFFIWAIATGLLPILLPNAVLAAATPALLVALATGILRGRRWARRWAIVYEAVILGGFLFNLAGGLLPVVQVGVSLTMVVTGAALPVALVALLMSPSARRAVEAAAPSTSMPARRHAPTPARLRPSAASAAAVTPRPGGE